MSCFCGCGRDVKGMRGRSQNAVAEGMARHLELFDGAMSVDGVTADRAAAAVPEGRAHLTVLRSVLHGERSRKDLDSGAIRNWHSEAVKIQNDLADQASRLGYHGPAGSVSSLPYRGQKSTGTIAVVEDTNVTVNRSFRIHVAIDVEPDDAEPFRVERTLLVSRVAIPRIGDRVDVAFDRDDPDDFVFRVIPN